MKILSANVEPYEQKMSKKEQIKVLEEQIATYKKEHPEQKNYYTPIRIRTQKLQNFTES